MDFSTDERTELLKKELVDFMYGHVYPNEAAYEEELDEPREPVRVLRVQDPQRAARRGPQPRAVEPLPSRRGRCRPDQHAVRTAGRNHRPQPHPGPGGTELRGAGHRQHGVACRVRHRGAEGKVAQAAAERRDPLGLRHDRTGRCFLGRDQHRDLDRARRRRLRHQRPQVVHHRCDEPERQDPDRHGQDRPDRRSPPPAEPDPGSARHPGREHQARHEDLRLRGPLQRRPRRDRVQGRARSRRRT